jgi:hypothetical protein
MGMNLLLLRGAWPVDYWIFSNDRLALARLLPGLVVAGGAKPLGDPPTRGLSHPLTIGDLGNCDRAITVEELANALGNSPGMIYRRVDEGSLPYFRICAAIRFCPITIAEHLALPTVISEPSIWARLSKPGPAMNAEVLAYLFHVTEQLILKGAANGEVPSIRHGARVTFYGPTVARRLQVVSPGITPGGRITRPRDLSSLPKLPKIGPKWVIPGDTTFRKKGGI